MSRAEQLVLRFKTFRTFVDEYSSRISEAGIFIASQTPHEVGTRVEFDLSLSAEFPLLRGVGEVVWRVDPGSSTEWTPGMAILFDEIDEPSRKLIHRLVEDYRQRGGTPFSLVRWPAGEAAPAPPARPEAPPARSGAPPPDSDSLRPSPYRGPVPGPTQRVDTTGWSALVDDHSSPAGEVARLPWEGERETSEEAAAAAGSPIVEEVEPAAPPVPEATVGEPVLPELLEVPPEVSGLEPPRAEPTVPRPEGGGLAPEGAVSAGPPAPPVPEPLVAPAADAGADWGLGAVERGEPESLAEVAAAEEPAEEWGALEPLAAEGPAGTSAAAEWGLGKPLAAELPELAEGIEGGAEEEISAVRIPQPIQGAAQSVGAGRARLLGLLLVLASVAAVAVVWRNEEISTLAEQWWPGAVQAVVTPREAPEASGPAAGEVVARTAETVTVTAAAEEEPAAEAADAAAEEAPGAEEPEPAGESAAPARERPPAERRAAAAAALTEVLRVSWETRPGETVLLIVGDAEIAEESVRVSRLDGDTPRQLVQLSGIMRPYGATRLEIGSPEIDRVRTGYHVDTQKRELHLVADLADAGVRLLGSEVQGRVLRLTFSRP